MIVSGGATGVDQAAVGEAKRLGMPYEVHLPDWRAHGKRAGAVRNSRIVESADEVAAFWDGTSRGTAITMEMAKRGGKPLRVWLSPPAAGRRTLHGKQIVLPGAGKPK